MAEPKVRFKRDDGSSYPAWTIVPFSKLSVPSGVQNKNDADLESYSISNDKGFVPQNEQFEDAGYLNNADRSLYYIVSPGSFAYNPARINIGSIGYQNVGKDVLVSSLYEIFNTTDELDDGFLMNWFKTEQFQKHVRRLSEGGVRQYFYYDKLCMVKFSLPCEEEQQKIADFLSSVDEVITASEEEVANLETQKKAVMKKIFSQEVRFKRADGSDFPEWEEARFGDTVTIERGGSPRPIESYITEGDGLNWVKIGDAPKYGNYITSTAQRIIPEGLRKTRQVFIGDLILSNSMSFGKPYIMGIDGCIHDGWLLIRNDQELYDLMYLCFLLGSDYMLKQYKSLAGGSAVNNLNKDLVAGTTVFIPCLEEQRLIADFLSDFDEAIAAAKKELELWKELKKGLLQQMFV